MENEQFELVDFGGVPVFFEEVRLESAPEKTGSLEVVLVDSTRVLGSHRRD